MQNLSCVIIYQVKWGWKVFIFDVVSGFRLLLYGIIFYDLVICLLNLDFVLFFDEFEEDIIGEDSEDGENMFKCS